MDLLSRIKLTQGDSDRVPKVCLIGNYAMFELMDAEFAAVDTVQEDFRCFSTSVIPIHKIRLVCTLNGTTYKRSSGTPSGLRYFQIVYNHPSGVGTIDGNEYIHPSFYDEDEIEELIIDQAHSVTFLNEDYAAIDDFDFRAFEIITKDEQGNITGQIGCGRTTDELQVSETNFTYDLTIDPYNWLGFERIAQASNGSILDLVVLHYDP